MYRISQKLDYFGNPYGWVPTLSIRVIHDFVDGTALPGLKIVEANYDKLMLAR